MAPMVHACCTSLKINAGNYFDVEMSGMRWSGTDRNKWRSGILLLEVEKNVTRILQPPLGFGFRRLTRQYL